GFPLLVIPPPPTPPLLPYTTLFRSRLGVPAHRGGRRPRADHRRADTALRRGRRPPRPARRAAGPRRVGPRSARPDPPGDGLLYRSEAHTSQLHSLPNPPSRLLLPNK